jgi:spore coat protein A, manganese oxidase
MTTTRRSFLKTAAFTGSALCMPQFARAVANSSRLTKWIQPMRGLGGPSGIPIMSGISDPAFAGTTLNQITVGEFSDQLHPQLGQTKLWGYWDTMNPVKRHLGGVIIANRGTANRLRITNTLPGTHLLPVDTTIPGANGLHNRSSTHLHGGLVPWISDGGPFGWTAPNGTHGTSFLNGPGGVLDNIPGSPMVAGQADHYYPNDQSTRLQWYHDHAVGITRLNAYAGIASGYLLLDALYDAQKTMPGTVPPLAAGTTMPLVFQDKVFVSSTTPVTDPTWATTARPDVQSIGSLWYEHLYDPKQFRQFKGKGALPPPNPSAIPEFFGDTMLCNGTVYPLLTVEAKRYRFFILNACNARFLNINTFRANPLNVDGIDLNQKTLFPTNAAGPNIIQIGTEGGYLAREVAHVSPKPFNPATLTGNLLLAPAERADVIMDFTGLGGQEFILYNDAPGPFPGGPATTDYYLGNPKNPVQPSPGTGPDTRQILRIRVVAAATPDPQPTGPILNPLLLDPAPIAPITTTIAPIPPLVAPVGTPVRSLTLNEAFDAYGRLIQTLGTTTPVAVGKGFGLAYEDPATELVTAGSTEVWRIFNNTADTHPIHFHLVNVQVLSRQPFKLANNVFTPTGVAAGPQPNELGWKETVQMHPGQVTSVVMKFDLPPVPFGVPTSPRTGGNEYVWHCHILEHEEHDMMRPLVVI